MITDARTLANGATIGTEVCVIGGGAAGITLALRLAASGRQVLLVESTLTTNPASTALNQGSIVGHPVVDGLGNTKTLEQTRKRGLGGGTNNHWSGYNRTLPMQGWPSGVAASVASYYLTAHDIVGLGPVNYDPAYWAGVLGKAQPVALGPGLEPTLFQRRAKNFVEYQAELQASASVTLLHDANVVSIDTDPSGSNVTSVTARTLNSVTLTITATAYVLAAGALENTRLLLASNSVVSAGVGNQHDQVGRYFGDDLGISFGLAVLANPMSELDWYAGHPGVATTTPSGTPTTIDLMCSPALTPEVLSELNLPRTTFGGAFMDYAQTTINQSGGITPMHLAELMKSGGSPAQSVYVFRALFTSQVNPASRVVLNGTTDVLGMPRLSLDWQLLPADVANIRSALNRVARAINGYLMQSFGWLSLSGGITINPVGDEPNWQLQTQYHHLGTTRMSELETDGVVDTNCRVHTTNNLFVAGSSVFPVPQGDTPTLTIVAMAARLADHLHAEVLA